MTMMDSQTAETQTEQQMHTADATMEFWTLEKLTLTAEEHAQNSAKEQKQPLKPRLLAALQIQIVAKMKNALVENASSLQKKHQHAQATATALQHNNALQEHAPQNQKATGELSYGSF